MDRTAPDAQPGCHGSRRAASHARTASSTPARCGRWRTRCACRIYDILSQYGPQTASSLAERLGESSGSTSYHLRALAKHDLIHECDDRGTGRERWWERPVGGVSFANPDAMKTPAGRAATQIVMNEFFRNRNEQLMRLHQRRASDGDRRAWQEGRLISTATARLTPEQSKELTAQDHGADRRRRGQLPQSDRRGRATRHHPGRRVPAARPGRTVMTAISAHRAVVRHAPFERVAAARRIRARRASSPARLERARRCRRRPLDAQRRGRRPRATPQARGAIGMLPR